MKQNIPTERDHEAQRAAWASSWFLSLLKARRLDVANDIERAQLGLTALGIRVLFDEDRVPEKPLRNRRRAAGEEVASDAR